MERIIILLILFALILSSCEKEKLEPNEKWTAGDDWIDTRDGQSYSTVKIGDQIWMAKNLNFWPESGSSVYDELQSNADIYGRLYNWETACSVCPEGWHLSEIDEWEILIDYLGGNDYAGGRLKQTSTTLWLSPNTGATNEVGFSALAGGMNWGYYLCINEYASFWTLSELYVDPPHLDPYGEEHAASIYLQNDATYVGVRWSKLFYQYSVRCVKDN